MTTHRPRTQRPPIYPPDRLYEAEEMLWATGAMPTAVRPPLPTPDTIDNLDWGLATADGEAFVWMLSSCCGSA
ncbi:MAG: hypothetical protein ACRDWE_00255 [Acidimicrobiales bacterium]